jgi:hypothetical protein
MDKEWFRKLRPLLKFRIPTDVVHVWHDQELMAGARWDKEIRLELARMDISYASLATTSWIPIT